MEAIYEEFRTFLTTMSIGGARIMGALTALSFLGKEILGGGMVRTLMGFCLGMVIYPMLAAQLAESPRDLLLLLGISVKELLLGMALGYLLTVIFWAIEAVGSFIDNQRGATMASSMDPLSGQEASLLGMLMTRTLLTLFFSTGLFLAFLSMIYESYALWPVLSFFPKIGQEVIDFAAMQFSLVTKMAVIVGAPVIIAMFLSEFGLGLISRFAPQLNVFFLSMSVKSALANFLLVLSWAGLILYFSGLLDDPGEWLQHLRKLLGPDAHG